MTFSSLAVVFLIGLVSNLSTSHEPSSEERIGAPYLLDTCVVSGKKLPSDGGVVAILDGETDAGQKGREVRFCCSNCKATFLKDPAKFIPKLDEMIIADQMPRYPRTVPCIVMLDESLPDPTGEDARDCKMLVSGNRLIRLCCNKCVRMFKRSPGKYLEVLDAAVIEEAMKAGKIKKCVVNGRPLTGQPHWFVLGDTAVATCCRGCQPKAEADPRGTIARLTDATR